MRIQQLAALSEPKAALNDDSNWFTHVVAKVPSIARTYQGHSCTPRIEWLPITGILADPEFKTFVIMIENTKFAVFDLIRKISGVKNYVCLTQRFFSKTF